MAISFDLAAFIPVCTTVCVLFILVLVPAAGDYVPCCVGENETAQKSGAQPKENNASRTHTHLQHMTYTVPH